MVDTVIEFLRKITSDCDELIVFLSSMFPLIELKGAIPIGAKLGLNLFVTAGFAYLGSTLVFIPVFFLLIPIFNLFKKIKIFKKLFEKIEGVFERKAEKIAKKTEGNADQALHRLQFKYLLLFVAVPFPVTGVWTGTAISVFLKMRFRDAFPAILLGNLISGSIITLLTFLFKDYVDYIIYTLFTIAIIMLIVFIVKVIVAKPNEEKGEELNEKE